MTNPFAFFDVDGTLLHVKSMFSFHDFWYQHWRGLNDPATIEEHRDVSAILRALRESDAPRELINRRYYEFFSGRSVDDVVLCAQAWARSVISDRQLFASEVINELESLRASGIEPVFVSGSFIEVLAPIAEHFGVRHMLATRLVRAAGKYTGRFEAPQTIGEGKAVAISEFLACRAVKAADCWAFGDDLSDLPMLKSVGHPVAVIGDSALGIAVRSRGWRCVQLNKPHDPQQIRAGLSTPMAATA